MKQVAILGERQAGVVDVPDPVAKDNWVVVKIHSSPMCTEYKAFVAGKTGSGFGHEAAGEVVAVDHSTRVTVGDRVVVMPLNASPATEHSLGGEYIYSEDQFDFAAIHGTDVGKATMAQYILKPDWLLVPIPDGMSYDHAGMACCGLGPSFGAYERMALSGLDTVLITGLGPVGLGAVINAVYRGARVIGVDGNTWRAQRAHELGAEAVLDPADGDILQRIRDLTDGRGVDKAIDCSGVVTAHRLCIDATKRRGSIVFVGESYDDTPIRVSPDMIRKGLTLMGSWHYSLKDTPRMMRMIGELESELNKLISHTFPMEQIQDAWELQASGQCAKVILHPWEGID